MTKRALLINPPVPDNKIWVREGRCQQWDVWGAPFPPFSLAMVSTQLVRAGFETKIIDSGPEHKDIDRVLLECAAFDPEVVVMASASPTIETDMGWFVPRLKKTLPRINIVAIGVHVTALPRPVLERYDALDYAVMGEPEITTRNLAVALTQNGTIRDIKGIAYRRADGTVAVNEPAGFAGDIDALGFPDWEKVRFENYVMPIIEKPFSMIGFSRGCPYACRYCTTHAFYGRNLRKRSVGSLIAEIKYNLSLGVHDFLFWTELMTADNDYLRSFLDAVMKEGLQKRIRWVCNSRVDSISKELARKMKEAGCWQMAFGFEFGDDRILQLALKGGKASLEEGITAARIVHEAGIAVDGHFIMGYPGETTETLRATMDYACSLPLTFAHFYAAVPFPGARLYQESIDKGWFEEGAWDLLTQDKASLKTEHLAPEVVQEHIRKAYIKFYFSLRVIARIYRIPRSFREFRAVTRLGLKFLRALKRGNQ